MRHHRLSELLLGRIRRLPARVLPWTPRSAPAASVASISAAAALAAITAAKTTGPAIRSFSWRWREPHCRH